MKIKHLGCYLMIVLLLGLTGCFEGKDDYSKQGVCIVNNTSVRATPSQKGQWLSSMALGETVVLEGNPEKDAADPSIEYIKIKLSDGTEGYANTYGIVRGAYVGVIQAANKIYQRPDLLANADQKLELMAIVAVEETKGNWLRISGEGRSKTGWITKDTITKEKEDVVTAVLLRKAIRGKENKLTKDDMDKIVAALPYPNNYFAVKIMEKFNTDTVQTQDTTFKDQPAASPGAANDPQGSPGSSNPSNND